MRILDSVSCGNGYTDAAKIDNVFNSSGGYFAVTGNDAYARLLYGKQGQVMRTAEFHVPLGNGILYPGTIGIEFRNYRAGQVAIVSAALSNQQEPSVAMSAGGVATPSTVAMITGIVASSGGIAGGTGFSVVHTGIGQYTITYTTPFVSIPTVVAVCNDGPGATVCAEVNTSTINGFNVITFTTVPALDNRGFNFIATPTV